MTAISSVPEARRAVPGSPIPEQPTFAAVYEASYARMIRLARLSLDGAGSAEEIVQDAFVQLFRNWDHVDAPLPWLRVAVVNGCRSWGRRRQVARRHPTVVQPPIIDDGDALAVRDALRSLRPRQRTAVVLRYFEDLPEREIAELLGCRP
jgi:RNA polymerase sigma factor (sigma-70 family)